ncbi:hypothetical protein ABW19_dt0208120 [Dactylella cylindrospora]|nr:hypothetical protein ABW19_dt0208120 [Dactylella cylindrospora]
MSLKYLSGNTSDFLFGVQNDRFSQNCDNNLAPDFYPGLPGAYKSMDELSSMVFTMERQKALSPTGWTAADTIRAIHKGAKEFASSYTQKYSPGGSDARSETSAHTLPYTCDSIDMFPEYSPGAAWGDARLPEPLGLPEALDFSVETFENDIDSILYSEIATEEQSMGDDMHSGQRAYPQAPLDDLDIMLGGFEALLTLNQPNGDCVPEPRQAHLDCHIHKPSMPAMFNEIGTSDIPDTIDADPTLKDLSDEFHQAVLKVYQKAKDAALSDRTSQQFQVFIMSLGPLDSIIKNGLTVLERLFDNILPASVKDVYCLINVAYGMSQSDPRAQPDLCDQEFQKSVSVLRRCLSESNTPSSLSDLGIFDEMVHVMAEEVYHALCWIKTCREAQPAEMIASIWNLLDQPKAIRARSTRPVANSHPVIPPKAPVQTEHVAREDERAPLHICPNDNEPPITVSASDFRSTNLFKGVVGFLQELDSTRVKFSYFCGRFCNSVALGVFRNKANARSKDPDYEKHPAYPSKRYFLEFLKLNLMDPMLLGMGEVVSMSRVVRTTFAMIEKGTLITLRDIEVYMMGLLLVTTARETNRFYFAGALHSQILHCASALQNIFPDYIKWPHEEPYSSQYAMTRKGLTMQEYAATISSTIEATTSPSPFSEPLPLQRQPLSPTRAPRRTKVVATATQKTITKARTQKTRSRRSSTTQSTPVSCPLCPQSFTRHSNMARHLEGHSIDADDDKTFVRCNLCPFKTDGARINEKLKNHIKRCLEKRGHSPQYIEYISKASLEYINQFFTRY